MDADRNRARGVAIEQLQARALRPPALATTCSSESLAVGPSAQHAALARTAPARRLNRLDNFIGPAAPHRAILGAGSASITRPESDLLAPASSTEESVRSEGLGEASAADVMSEDDELVDVFEIGVEPDKAWHTLEDEDMQRVARIYLASCARARPLLPPRPDDATEPWLGTASGIALPICHCAVRGCSWISDRLPCSIRSVNDRLRVSCEGMWKQLEPSQDLGGGIYACCGEAQCLRHHLLDAHLDTFLRCCGRSATSYDSYSFCLEAISLCEQQTIPKLGCSIDRRAFQHVKQDLSDSAVQALVCMCCARILTSSNGTSKIARIECVDYVGGIAGVSFKTSWCFGMFDRNYADRYPRHESPVYGHPELKSGCWMWRRRLDGTSFSGRVILCCPEDVQCDEGHSDQELCDECVAVAYSLLQGKTRHALASRTRSRTTTGGVSLLTSPIRTGSGGSRQLPHVPSSPLYLLTT